MKNRMTGYLSSISVLIYEGLTLLLKKKKNMQVRIWPSAGPFPGALTYSVLHFLAVFVIVMELYAVLYIMALVRTVRASFFHRFF